MAWRLGMPERCSHCKRELEPNEGRFKAIYLRLEGRLEDGDVLATICSRCYFQLLLKTLKRKMEELEGAAAAEW
jgi:hypothetical protein